MLKLILIFLLAGIINSNAQSPGMMNYQGVARDASGAALINQTIKVRFKIRDLAPYGAVLYSQTKSLTTNSNGLFNLIIGSNVGTVTGSWASINWSAGLKYLQVEMDPNGGSAYINMGSQQLVSVPFAEHANSAGSLALNASINTSQIYPSGAINGQVLMFNGTSWVPANSTGGIGLPFSGLGSVDSALFTVTNTNTDAAAKAISGQTVSGIGVFGHSENHQGLYGSSNSTLYPAIMGYTYNQSGTGIEGRTQNGMGVYGNSTNSGTGVFGTSTLGTGVKGISTGTTSNAAGVIGISNFIGSSGVLGTSTSGNGIKGTTYGASGSAGVYGESIGNNSSNGVLGIANFSSGYGVQGSSTVGTGVLGYSNNNVGVYGNTISGTALKGYSISGFGLEVTGNVKISGGNTSPGAGKILTSDANGNATWQNSGITPKVGFRARGINTGSSVVSSGVWQKVYFGAEQVDYGNCYNTVSQTPASALIVPVSGFYNISAITNWLVNSSYDFQNVEIRIRLNRNGNTSTIAALENIVDQQDASSSINTQYPLIVGDEVWIEVKHLNIASQPQTLSSIYSEAVFSAFLIFAD